ncbi:MAG TPA: MarR family transcriptional regulator [Lachnospiraceae bacterium]|nr:MarR family transcriptional regulator [Lachnospiraceae bacterium]
MEHSFLSALIQTSCLHRAISREEFQKLDLSEGQPKILLHLLSGNGILQKDLSHVCNVKPATMTALLQKMLVKNLVIKKEIRVSGGKRGYLIFLTEPGRELAYQVVEVFDQIEKICFQGFSEQERDQLVFLLNKVSDNLRQRN